MEGKYNGRGKLQTPDGKIFSGNFKNGKFLG
jgi:hypothetical protein